MLRAPAISVRLQPNSCSSGSTKMPSTGLKKATRENATIPTAPATHQPTYPPRLATKRGMAAWGRGEGVRMPGR